MMKKFILTMAAVCVACISQVSAQEYQWGIGVRGAVNSSGLSVKYNMDPVNTVEAIFAFQHGFNIFALYERNVPVIDRGFHFIYGFGANMGEWKHKGEDEFTVGFNAIVGLEYKFPNAPLAVSVDYKPILNVTGNSGLKPLDFGLTLKAAF